MVSKWLERKIDDVILGLAPVPYLDEEVLELAEGWLGFDVVPGLKPMNYHDLSLWHKIIILAPVIDNEYFDFFGVDLFKGPENKYSEEYSDSDEAKYNHSDQDAVMADGGERNPEDRRSPAERVRDLRTDGGRGEGYKVPGWLFTFFKVSGIIALIAVIGFGAFGLFGGSGWGFVLGDMFGGYTSGLGNVGEELGYTVNSAITTATCLGDAGCFNEWRLNQTTEPGSEDVGETYELQVDGPRVFGTSAGGIDISNIPPDYPIPMDFSIHNTRNGLDGIDAKNVDYRFLIRDPRVLGTGEVLCTTADLKSSEDNGWISLDKYRGSDSLSSDLDETRDTILPGGTVSPLKYSAEERLTVKDCGLLQPGTSNSYEVVLQVKYDYSAFSILQMQVMSEQHRRDSGIEVRSKRSETPDTPVETFVRASSPATYRTVRNTEGNVVERVASPIRAELGFSADEDNIRYRIDPSSFVFKDSGLTEVLPETCGGLKKSGGDTFSLSDSIRDQISRTQDGDGGSWFSSRSKPSSAYCTFGFDPSEISPTGETITFTARADYTVLQDEPKEEAFTIRNTLCRSQNCPQVVALEPNEETATTALRDLETGTEAYREKKYSRCGQPQDAQNGCSVIESFSLEDRAAGSLTDEVIPEGELAVELRESMGGRNFYTCYSQNKASPDYGIIPLSEEELKKLWQNGQRALNYTQDGWEMTNLIGTKTPSTGC